MKIRQVGISQKKWAFWAGMRNITENYKYILINHNYYFKIPLRIQMKKSKIELQ
jgi:hypothetical protein